MRLSKCLEDTDTLCEPWIGVNMLTQERSTMRYRITAVLVVIVASFLYIVGPLQTHAKPHSTHDSSAGVTWPGTMGGASTTMNPEFPSMPVGGLWSREIEITNANLTVAVFAGMESSLFNSNSLCGDGMHFYYVWTNNPTHCLSVGSPGPNCDFSIEQYDSTTVKVNIDCGNGTGGCPGFSCNISLNQTWGNVFMEEYVDSTWAGELTSVDEGWLNNKYREGTTWHYQALPSSCNTYQNGCPTFGAGGSPPEMYWFTYPANSSTGGYLVSCERSDGKTPCP